MNGYTSWHEFGLDVYGKLDELNGRLKERGFRTRFRIVMDESGWDVVVDDRGNREFVETAEEAETIVEELLGDQ